MGARLECTWANFKGTGASIQGTGARVQSTRNGIRGSVPLHEGLNLRVWIEQLVEPRLVSKLRVDPVFAPEKCKVNPFWYRVKDQLEGVEGRIKLTLATGVEMICQKTGSARTTGRVLDPAHDIGGKTPT